MKSVDGNSSSTIIKLSILHLGHNSPRLSPAQYSLTLHSLYSLVFYCCIVICSLLFQKHNNRSVPGWMDGIYDQLLELRTLWHHLQFSDPQLARIKGGRWSHVCSKLEGLHYDFYATFLVWIVARYKVIRLTWIDYTGNLSASRQKGLSTSHLCTQLDPFALKLTNCTKGWMPCVLVCLNKTWN